MAGLSKETLRVLSGFFDQGVGRPRKLEVVASDDIDIIISTEEVYEEDSLAERMSIIGIPKDKQPRA